MEPLKKMRIPMEFAINSKKTWLKMPKNVVGKNNSKFVLKPLSIRIPINTQNFLNLLLEEGNSSGGWEWYWEAVWALLRHWDPSIS